MQSLRGWLAAFLVVLRVIFLEADAVLAFVGIPLVASCAPSIAANCSRKDRASD
jgi:hypothetical protein